MKKFLIPLVGLLPLLTGCKHEEVTGESQISVMFWIFIGAIAICLIVLIALLCKKFPKNKNKR